MLNIRGYIFKQKMKRKLTSDDFDINDIIAYALQRLH